MVLYWLWCYIGCSTPTSSTSSWQQLCIGKTMNRWKNTWRGVRLLIMPPRSQVPHRSSTWRPCEALAAQARTIEWRYSKILEILTSCTTLFLAPGFCWTSWPHLESWPSTTWPKQFSYFGTTWDTWVSQDMSFLRNPWVTYLHCISFWSIGNRFLLTRSPKKKYYRICQDISGRQFRLFSWCLA